MRKLLAVGLLVVLALPAAAADCQTVGFDGGYITSRTGNVDTVATALIGPYLQVQVGETAGDDERVGTVSHEIGASTGAVVCPDGSVTFTQATPEPLPVLVEDTVTDETGTAVVFEPLPVLHPGSGGVQEF